VVELRDDDERALFHHGVFYQDQGGEQGSGLVGVGVAHDQQLAARLLAFEKEHRRVGRRALETGTEVTEMPDPGYSRAGRDGHLEVPVPVELDAGLDHDCRCDAHGQKLIEP